MANELRVTMSIAFDKGGSSIHRSFSDSIDVDGNSFQHSVQTVATSEETLAIHSDIGTVGYVFIQNMDSSNFIQLGPATGRTDFKLLAGEGMIFRLNSGTTIYMKADTSSVDVEYIVVEL